MPITPSEIDAARDDHDADSLFTSDNLTDEELDFICLYLDRTLYARYRGKPIAIDLKRIREETDVNIFLGQGSNHFEQIRGLYREGWNIFEDRFCSRWGVLIFNGKRSQERISSDNS